LAVALVQHDVVSLDQLDVALEVAIRAHASGSDTNQRDDDADRHLFIQVPASLCRGAALLAVVLLTHGFPFWRCRP